MRAYLQAVENGYPVMVYEVIAEFTVTYNQNCALSLYTDQYIFTGGAHGSNHAVRQHLGSEDGDAHSAGAAGAGVHGR